MNKRKVITVDGLAGSGKTSLSHALAQRLGFAHLNSGLLYRAIGLICIRCKLDTDNQDAIVLELNRHKIELGEAKLFVDSMDETEACRDPKVSEATSTVSALPKVRNYLIQMQREVYPGKDLVAEGRDMGTVVFPEAPLKFFIKADPRIRVARRLRQLSDAAGQDAKKLELLKKTMEQEIIERDKRDTERAVSPTVPATDAIVIDNSAQSLTETVQTMYALASQRGLITS